MNTFPARTPSSHQQQPQQMAAGFPPGVAVPGMPHVPGVPGVPGLPGGHGMPPPGMHQMAPGMPIMADPQQHLAMLQQQNPQFIAQQQAVQQQAAQQAQLAAMSHQQHVAATRGTGKKTKKSRATPQAQMLPRNMAALQPPHGQEHYLKNAMAPPGAPIEPMEPWADSLDELDPRELAMARFRARHEVFAEVFGPERVQDIPGGGTDAWAGLGIDGETLEAKVLALESSNAELEDKFDSELEDFRKRLEAAGSEVPLTA